MPNPLDALRNARSIGADPHPHENWREKTYGKQVAPQTADSDPIAWPKAPGMPDAFTKTAEIDTPNIPHASVFSPFADDMGNVQGDPNAGTRMGWGVPGDGKLTGVLEGLRAAGGTTDPTAKLYALQDKLRDEIAINVEKGNTQAALHPGDRATYGFSTGATPEALRQATRDLAENPVSQYQTQKQDEAQREYEARLGGFSGPQQAAQFGRSLETAKTMAPVQAAQANAAGNVEVQRLRNEGSDDFFQRLAITGALPPGMTMRGPNGAGITTAPVSPTAVNSDTKAAEKLEAQIHALESPSSLDGITTMFGGTPREVLLANKKKELASIYARIHGGVPQQSAEGSANGLPVGSKRTINGIPAMWDGQGWLPEHP